MKTLIAILVAAGVAFGAGYIVVSNSQDAKLKQAQAEWDKQRAELEAAANQPGRPARTIVVNGPATEMPKESPAEILDALTKVKIGSGTERNPSLRKVVFGLEKLAACSSAAVPAIKQFLAGNVDVDYAPENENQNNDNAGNPDGNATATSANPVTATTANNPAGGRGNGGGRGNAAGGGRGFNVAGNNGNNNGGNGGGGGFGGFAGRGQRQQNLRMDWIVPPSLRLGLVGVLHEIGGADAEQALVEMLNTTGRGVEVAYLARTLEAMSPGKYREAAITAAKELLTNPVSISNPDRLDELSKNYLYGVLELFGDVSFTPTAQALLVGMDGRIDRAAMDYLSTVLKEQSVAAFYQAYQDQRLTNQNDRMTLQREILAFAGQNPQANALFQQLVTDPNAEGRQRLFPVMQLVGGFGGGPGGGGFGGNNDATDPQILQQRLALLNSTRQSLGANADEQTVLVLTTAAKILEDRINGVPTEGNPWGPVFNRGGGGGGGGNNNVAQQNGQNNGQGGGQRGRGRQGGRGFGGQGGGGGN